MALPRGLIVQEGFADMANVSLGLRANDLRSWFAHLPLFFRENADLGRHLQDSELANILLTAQPVSPLSCLRKFIKRTALPNSIELVFSPEGGETTAKTALLTERFPVASTFHLMCYAGQNATGPVLLNLLKPVSGVSAPSSLWIKTGNGGEQEHLVLNKPAAAELLDGFEALTSEELARFIGMQAHSVNFLLDTEKFDGCVDLRCVFDPAISEKFFATDTYQLQFVEVPVGAQGKHYSIVVPVEFFLAFICELRKQFPHIELPGSEHLSKENIQSAMSALKELLSSENIENLLVYNEKRPVMAGFNAFVATLSKELTRRAPYIPIEIAKQAITNFVRHFFAVEYNLVSEAMTVDGEALHVVYLRLKATEFGRFLLPVNTFEEFFSKVQIERSKSQPPIPFSFSNEQSKSAIYLARQERMGAKLAHVLNAISRDRERDILHPFRQIKERLIAICAEKESMPDPESLESAADDFVSIIFRPHRTILSKIDSKMRAMGTPREADDYDAGVHWSNYWVDLQRMLTDMESVIGLQLDSQGKKLIMRRAILPEVQLLLQLPYSAELYGSEQELLNMLLN